MARLKRTKSAVAAKSAPRATATKGTKTSKPKAKATYLKPRATSRTGDSAPPKAAPKRRTPKELVDAQASLSKRLREIRRELFGDQGGPELARRLNLPARTWYNYETGVTVPAEVLLRFLVETRAEPAFVLTGKGPMYRPKDKD